MNTKRVKETATRFEREFFFTPSLCEIFPLEEQTKFILKKTSASFFESPCRTSGMFQLNDYFVESILLLLFFSLVSAKLFIAHPGRVYIFIRTFVRCVRAAFDGKWNGWNIEIS